MLILSIPTEVSEHMNANYAAKSAQWWEAQIPKLLERVRQTQLNVEHAKSCVAYWQECERLCKERDHA